MVKPVGLKVTLPMPAADGTQRNQEIIIQRDNKSVIKGIFWGVVAFNSGLATFGMAGVSLGALRFLQPTTFLTCAGITGGLGYIALHSSKNAYYHFTSSKETTTIRITG